MDKIQELRDAENKAVAEVRSALDALTAASTDEEIEAREAAFNVAEEAAVKAKEARVRAERIAEARAAYPAPAVEEKKEDLHPNFNINTRGQLTYNERSRNSFFTDVALGGRGDRDAQARLAKHQAEMRDLAWDANTGGDDLIAPLYLAEYYAGVARAGRPFADALGARPLTAKGTVLSVPKLSTGTSAAAQDGGNGPVSETDATTETVTASLVTVAGQQDMSLQLFERGEAVDQIIFADLQNDYNTKLDSYLINGTAANGQPRGIRNVSSVNTVTYTDGSPSVAAALPKVYDAIQKVASNRYAPATHVVMHPRRAAWFAAGLSTSAPLFQQGGFNQAVGAQNVGAIQTIAGLPVVSDANIGTTYGVNTNQDEIYVVYAPDFIFMEGPLRTRVDYSILSGTLQVRLQLFAYSFFMANRMPKAISIISGTGLVTPAF